MALNNVPRIVVSATHKSSGKTVTTVGLCAALTEMGMKVQPFKKGPDYIDPMWLSAAAERPCRNLDYFMFGWENLMEHFTTHAEKADISVIEGNKGLYDSVDLDGEGSTASLARKIKAPVVLVVDASRITRGIAPLLIGYKAFEPDIRIAGVILNKVASKRQEAKLKSVVEKYCDIEILGCIRKSENMELLERHLGLIPLKEDMGLYPYVEAIRKEVSSSVNIQRIIEIARSAEKMDVAGKATIDLPEPTAKIGVITDRAFTFYYPENLRALQESGAQLVPVNALRDKILPEGIDGLYIGGGFPETMMERLERNGSLRGDILLAIENGLPVHAECGGLVYLARSISWNGKQSDMVGAIDCDVVINKKPQGHGYMQLEPTGKSPWFTGMEVINAHEFHYAELKNLKCQNFAFKVKRGTGIDGNNDGIVYKNVTASFAHLHHLGCPEWASSFVSYCERIDYSKSRRQFVNVLDKVSKMIT